MEQLINRVAMMLQYGSKKEAIRALKKEGLDDGTIFLVYCAAKRFNQEVA